MKENAKRKADKLKERAIRQFANTADEIVLKVMELETAAKEVCRSKLVLAAVCGLVNRRNSAITTSDVEAVITALTFLTEELK